jgi:putative hydrolase of the HAD superfamily
VAAGVAAYHDAKKGGMEPFPGLLGLLEALRDAGGLRLGVVTEGLEVKQYEKLHRLGVYPFLDRDSVFVSDAIGISKPNPKLLQRALAGTGVPPGEAMYVGDNPVNDVGPAKAVGMVAVRFRSPGGKHSRVDGPVPPDQEVADHEALRTVLREVYGVAV